MTKKKSKPVVVTLGGVENVSCTCKGAKPPVVAQGKDGDVFEPASGATKRKRRNYGTGSFCVFSRNDKLVRCFRQRETAEKVARGFGPGFRVKDR